MFAKLLLVPVSIGIMAQMLSSCGAAPSDSHSSLTSAAAAEVTSEPSGSNLASAQPAGGKVAINPARLLDCNLGRITNFDPNQVQGPADYKFEGRHAFRLFLAAAPVRTTPPPSALKEPEPVDPRTRILADPDNLSRGASASPFYRVVDMWPERVEMVTPIADTASNLVILSDYDRGNQTVNLFMTAAQDGMTFDQEHLYAGRCRVKSGQEAEGTIG